MALLLSQRQAFRTAYVALLNKIPRFNQRRFDKMLILFGIAVMIISLAILICSGNG